ncbi:MAG: hypothetical protein GOVbin1807_118 [Prokaryotic dsDNA virus sp.]|nr:MAG: hypothetical protein GOVbin1807_118 [Prokaryotic dsDNA virus sp.]|tara:strand:+ start:28 stop:423 length:396 start_codon:yes stop_codon:yes gene_type:complete
MILLLLSSLAWGSLPEYTYIEAGEPAPFSGRLFNDAAADILAEQIEMGPKECQINLEYQLGVQQAEHRQAIEKLKSSHKFDIQILEAEVKAKETRIESLEELKTPPKKKLWFSLGLITGVGTTIAIANAVN